MLVVGGAGYIGSHCVHALAEGPHRPVVVDNLVYGHKAALPQGIPFYNNNLGNKNAISSILQKESIEAVMHFGAYAYVGESVEDPLKYYINNVAETLYLLEAMQASGVTKFIFSSSCATYGTPDQLPITEETPQKPINPYGQTKLDIEQALKALATQKQLSFVALRYFNAAGASLKHPIGEDHTPETHLIPLVCEVALGKRPHVSIFGTDYPTPDGTCLRDYVHVDDLATAHILALDHLNTPGTQLFINLSTGKPYSVREVIQTVESVSSKRVTTLEAPRRPGDPATLYADPTRAKQILNWQPKHSDLGSIIQSAWSWHAQHPNGFHS